MEIIKEVEEEIKELNEVEKFIDYAKKELDIQNAVFDIIIIDNERIHEINKEYRSKDMPTDVISFALEDFMDVETEVRLLGDIYISIDKAREQAKLYNHSLLRELAFLSIHGLLHLLGYDHMTEEDKKVMREKEELILKNVFEN